MISRKNTAFLLLLTLLLLSFNTHAYPQEMVGSFSPHLPEADYQHLLASAASSDPAAPSDHSIEIIEQFIDSNDSFLSSEAPQVGITAELRYTAEREPNNTMAEANVINDYFYGQYEYHITGWINNTYDDVDFLTFTTPFVGDLVVVGNWTGSLKEYIWEEYMGVFLLNENGDVLRTAVPIVLENTLWTALAFENLPPGTYYLAVLQTYDTSNFFVGQRYGVSVGFYTEGCHVTEPRNQGGASFIGFTFQDYSFSSPQDTVCTGGHAVQHQYDFGNGIYTSWMSGITAIYRWPVVGTYLVRIRARCATHPTITTEWFPHVNVEIRLPCQLPVPVLVDPPTSGDIFTSIQFTAETQYCDYGHPLEYRFDWSNQITDWHVSKTKSKRWPTVGTYPVRVQTRCEEYNQFTSAWSEPFYIEITAPLLQLNTSANHPEWGTFTESGEYMQTATVSAIANPHPGYAFHRWLENDITVTRTNPYTFQMLDHRTLHLQFRKRIQPERISGSDRFQTSIAVSQAGWADDSTDYVMLARSHDFADALAGVPLAYALNAPILLTPTHTVYTSTLNEIQRLGASHVILLGGTGAIGDEVADLLNGQGLDVERISGSNRYATAAAIAHRLALVTGTLTDAVIAVGTNFPDALSAASYAAYHGQPILLVHNTVLPVSTRDALINLNIENVVIAGGVGAISQDIVDALPISGTRTRVSGANRYTTAVEMAKHFGPAPSRLFIATGVDFPDAITGAVLAAKENSGILLVLGPRVAPYDSAQDYLVDEEIQAITLLGGSTAISLVMEQWF